MIRSDSSTLDIFDIVKRFRIQYLKISYVCHEMALDPHQINDVCGDRFLRFPLGWLLVKHPIYSISFPGMTFRTLSPKIWRRPPNHFRDPSGYWGGIDKVRLGCILYIFPTFNNFIDTCINFDIPLITRH